jgi:hypothetical protein
MSTRQVTDEEGRVWLCKPEESNDVPGRDVHLVCTTATAKKPLRITVSWNWAKMAEKGLARLINAKGPELLPG